MRMLYFVSEFIKEMNICTSVYKKKKNATNTANSSIRVEGNGRKGVVLKLSNHHRVLRYYKFAFYSTATSKYWSINIFKCVFV